VLNRPFVITLSVLLILAYLGALTVSTAHLSQLYALFNAGLPYSVSIGLAVALEAVAFLFSIISTSLGKRAGPWAAWASTSALLLVWAGNGYAMMLAAPKLQWYVVLAASCFVPVCTLFVGKVLGGLFGLLDELGQQDQEDQPQQNHAHTAGAPIVTAAAAVVVSQPAVQVRSLSPQRGQRVPAVVTKPAGQKLNQAVNPDLDVMTLPEPIRREGRPLHGDSPAVPVEANARILKARPSVSPATPTAPPIPAVPTTPGTDLLESQLQALGLRNEDLEVMIEVWTERRGNQQQGGVRPKVSVSVRDEVALALLSARNVRPAELAQQLGIGERRARAVATEVRTLLKARGCWVEATA
jgi:hypothetical protein